VTVVEVYSRYGDDGRLLKGHPQLCHGCISSVKGCISSVEEASLALNGLHFLRWAAQSRFNLLMDFGSSTTGTEDIFLA
jgi:hypothetical protein